jgi:hypothetical protein
MGLLDEVMDGINAKEKSAGTGTGTGAGTAAAFDYGAEFASRYGDRGEGGRKKRA